MICRSWLLLSLLLCGAVWSTAAPLEPSTSTSPTDAAADAPLISTPYPRLTQMAISEFTVDRNGLWTDTEVPLSDASMRAIREATLASPEDEEAVASGSVEYTATAAAADEMETSAVEENENEAEAEAVEGGVESERETPITLDDAESHESQSETSAIDDQIDIATGPRGRMILIPRSSRLEMDPLVNRLTRIISELKQHSPTLDRITLKLEIEPLIPRQRQRHVMPIPRIRPSYRRLRIPRVRPPARARGPISLRLVPSRSEIRTRAMLARCRMLLRQALKKLKRMKLRMRTWRRRRIMPRRKPQVTRLGRWLRRLGVGRAAAGGVTILRGNRFEHNERSSRRISRGNIDIEAEKNSTAKLFAPSIALRMSRGSMLVVNRGVIVIVNRSANNTLSVTPPPPPPAPHRGSMFRRFMSSPSHLELAAAVNAPALTIEPAAALDAADRDREDTDTNTITPTSTPNEN